MHWKSFVSSALRSSVEWNQQFGWLVDNHLLNNSTIWKASSIKPWSLANMSLEPSHKHYQIIFKKKTSYKHNADIQMADFMMSSNIHTLAHLFHVVTASSQLW